MAKEAEPAFTFNRKLDIRNLADHLGVQLVHETSGTLVIGEQKYLAKTSRWSHDEDLAKFFRERKNYMILHSATYRDGEYTVRYFYLQPPLDLPPGERQTKQPKKQPKRTKKKKKAT